MNNTEDSFNKYGKISFDQRKANAVRAYWEWMPIRQVDLDDDLRWKDLFSQLTTGSGETSQWDRSSIWLSWTRGNMIGISQVFSC
jgi:alkaline phosphatase D